MGEGGVGCVWDHLRDGYLPWGCFVSGWVLGIQKQDEILILAMKLTLCHISQYRGSMVFRGNPR